MGYHLMLSSAFHTYSLRFLSYSLPKCILFHNRLLRTRIIPSKASERTYTLENPITSLTWPPLHDHGSPMTLEKCRCIMYHLQLLEIERLEKARKFKLPEEIKEGDLIQVKYELSRTQQTFAVFTGYCIRVRKKGLNSSITLSNTYDGVGVTQTIPLLSPRILHLKIAKDSGSKPASDIYKPLTRDYRYKWQYNVRSKYGLPEGTQKPGIRSLEPRLRRQLQDMRKAYYEQRKRAGLPPYAWPGPMKLLKRERYRAVRAETRRRILIYSMDEQRARAEKLSRRRKASRWGVYKLPYKEDKEPT